MRVYAQVLLVGLRCPEIGRGSKILFDGIPKVRAPVASVKETEAHVWGICVRKNISIQKMLVWPIIILVLGLTFVPFFASLALVITVFTLFILKLGAHTDLRL
jgi:hypothetical protein